jgi:hypothetical protein
VKTQEVLTNLLGGAMIGMIALAMDYFFLQYLFKTPISMGGGLTIWAVLIYILVPFLIVQFAGK